MIFVSYLHLKHPGNNDDCNELVQQTRLVSITKNALVVFEPTGLRISAPQEATVLGTARSGGLHIASECGGKGTCGSCKVILQPVPNPTRSDRQCLSKEEIAQGYRLACQHTPVNGMRVIVPQNIAEAKILTETKPRSRTVVPDPGLQGKIGFAVDIGTTTIVVYMMDLESGIQVAQAAALNPQIAYGEDVMSRITYAMNKEDGSEALKNKVVGRVDRLISELCESQSVDYEDVVRYSFVGNTAMHHLFLGLEVANLGLSPYNPTISSPLKRRAHDVGLTANTEAEAYFAPNLAGFVGGDTVGFILSQELHKSDTVSLGIDVGTNGEIVVSRRGELFCCSAAAGSAFEGATIRDGMRGQKGAIEYISIESPEEPPKLTVIGDITPRGICGSAIVDIVVELKENELLDSTGRLTSGNRIEEHDDFGKLYVIAEERELGSNRRIVFTQKDVRQVQLAKAAIRAGVQILMQEAEIAVDDLEVLYLAGAFGNYIRPSSALKLGLLPPVDKSMVIPVGNAAGDGAKRLLLSENERKAAKEFSERVRYVELANHDDFTETFTGAMSI
ncbi:MAG: DUF4445 domain-containing protein [Candidatus Lokiarchaeota archaeon]|nr:DUF4445 domain-containing protein [Candidatus Lokiarchaeota archaeon]